MLYTVYKRKTECCHPSYSCLSNWSITHSLKHWSTKKTMLEDIIRIIVAYVERVRDDVGEKSAAVIIDNFKGQITNAVIYLLEEHGIHVCLLPANTTYRLLPMDIGVNKPAKDFLKWQFEEWNTEVSKQLQGKMWKSWMSQSSSQSA